MTHEKTIEKGMTLLSNNQIEEAIREFKESLLKKEFKNLLE